jgi:FkbM family methyltransferase
MYISSKINGINYVIKNPNDYIQKELSSEKQWNSQIVDIIKTYINDRKLTHFLNVGAHIGTVALPISLHIKDVTAIEAYPKTYSDLVENISLNNILNVAAVNIALGNSEEDVYFIGENSICPFEHINRIKNNTGGMHVLTETDIKENRRSANLTDKRIKNKMNKLDNLNIKKIDIVLVDIEGGEYEFLLGAENKLKLDKPIIIIEIWDNYKRITENMTTKKEDIINYITQLGYNLIKNIGDDFIFEPVN